ncbi:hypothetical protein CEXT_17791 [Caerostris extrusa]|uniref:Uncharacterized protein n=1 Tax=Caerostris extrusa TaxID=172846 RepID=A0AAV4W0A5_CAEEX|nr:hypothetical protein CEXT_17791 [Caerostris extrusa]
MFMKSELRVKNDPQVSATASGRKCHKFPMIPKVGFKPPGGIRTVKDVLLFQDLIKKELGSKWMHPHLFRIVQVAY